MIMVLLGISPAAYAAGTAEVRFAGGCLQADIASSDEERATGLMRRDKLDPQKGMLFIFERQLRYSFWMKEMNFPLDIIWISQDKTVVDITRNAQPCAATCESLFPAEPAKYVLEVNAGFSAQHRIQIGDRIDF